MSPRRVLVDFQKCFKVPLEVRFCRATRQMVLMRSDGKRLSYPQTDYLFMYVGAVRAGLKEG